MTNPSTPAAPSVPEEGREPSRLYQCPGCWSWSMNPMTADGYECECGERLTRVDLRDSEASTASTPSHDGLAALRDALLTIPLGANGITSAGWNRYDTDDEHVLHLWSGTWEPGGQSWDLRVPKTLPAASTASTPSHDGLAALDAEIARRESPDYQWFAKPSPNQPPTERAGQAAVRGQQHGELVGLKLARELLRSLPAASTASTGQDEATSWNAAIDAAMDAVAAVVPVRKVGASVDVARSDVLYALLGVRRLVPSTEATEAAGEEAGP